MSSEVITSSADALGRAARSISVTFYDGARKGTTSQHFLHLTPVRGVRAPPRDRYGDSGESSSMDDKTARRIARLKRTLEVDTGPTGEAALCFLSGVSDSKQPFVDNREQRRLERFRLSFSPY